MTVIENRHSRAHVDIVLLMLVFAMSLFGVVAVCVATFSPDSNPDTSFLNHIFESSYAVRQALFLLIAPLVIGVIIAIPFDVLRRYAGHLYWASFILLSVVTIFNRAQGVKAWLDIIWGYTIQPSEFAKLSLILVLARDFARTDRPMATFRATARMLVVVGLPGVVILLQGETGSLLVIIFMFAVMMFFANVPLKTIIIMASIALLLVLSVYGLMIATGSTDYRLARIAGWLNPDLYSTSDAYQQTQSKMVIGSGGMNGIGMFVNGSMAQLNYVPADWTDFIFATIGETWGFVGCVCVLLGYMLILFRLLYLAWFTRDKFGRMIIIGVMGMLLFHVLENVAMTLGLMPITGIPLPFLSYGGSNMVTNMGGIGLVLNVTRNRSISIPVNTPQTMFNPYRIRKQFKTKS